MKISTRGRYALRVMLDLAEHNNGEYIPLMDIAKRQEISEKYLESIVSVLSKQKFVKALRGKGGGYQMCIRDSFEAMEKLLKSEDCPTGIYCANDITAVGMLKYLRRCRNLYFTPSILSLIHIYHLFYCFTHSRNGNTVSFFQNRDDKFAGPCMIDSVIRKCICNILFDFFYRCFS